MKIFDLLSQPEGRRLEFKSTLPINADLAKTVVAFANDAGGEIYIGIDDKSRDVVGIDDNEYPQMEEHVLNLIYDRCYPAILPEISLFRIKEKAVVRVKVYRGSQPPYYLKNEGKKRGTYIRIGSNNRRADAEIILELERRRRNVSFDSESTVKRCLETLKKEGVLVRKGATKNEKWIIMKESN